ncbi:bacterial regulatory s, tetR family protein [Collimonas pratensis]|uniref:Bacterial regulatory s, tetR family protein n=3 Tax=Collimonas pratensis TaxID=279113 RepID=A0A127Q866_9BURK|nr:bacterial regulatory s, tetR family protein [Collimonas pratensis]
MAETLADKSVILITHMMKMAKTPPVEKQKIVLDRALLKPAIQQRIEGAVLDLFSEREFHSVSFGEIAAAANVSLQTIYKYYGSKEALLFACLETWLGALASRMLDHLQGIESCQDKLRKVFWVVLDFFDRNPKVSQLIMSSLQISAWGRDRTFRQPEMMEVLMKTLTDGRAEGVLTDEVNEKILLDYFIGILERLVHMHTMRGEQEPLALQANALFKMLWRAIARPANH